MSCSISRFVTYYESTKPIIDHYEKLGLVRKIDAARDVNEVSSISVFRKNSAGARGIRSRRVGCPISRFLQIGWFESPIRRDTNFQRKNGTSGLKSSSNSSFCTLMDVNISFVPGVRRRQENVPGRAVLIQTKIGVAWVRVT